MSMLDTLRRWKTERRNIRILQTMSDRQLNDIGISRSEISRRVRGRV